MVSGLLPSQENTCKFLFLLILELIVHTFGNGVELNKRGAFIDLTCMYTYQYVNIFGIFCAYTWIAVMQVPVYAL